MIIAMVMVLAATASAAPIKLVCNLTRTTVLNRVDRQTRTLTIDFNADTVTLESYAQNQSPIRMGIKLSLERRISMS
jgi:hypothetical protein